MRTTLIVQEIVKHLYNWFLYEEQDAILACSRINLVWAHEVNRRLYGICGWYRGGYWRSVRINGLEDREEYGTNPLTIRNSETTRRVPYLVDLTSLPINRFHHLTQYIHTLICGTHSHGGGIFYHELDPLGIRTFNFPILRQLWIEGASLTRMQEEGTIFRLLIPSLTSIRLGNIRLSPTVIQGLIDHCPGLEDLWIHPTVQSGPDFRCNELFARYLATLRHLTCLVLSQPTLLSSQSLWVLANMSRLRRMEVQHLEHHLVEVFSQNFVPNVNLCPALEYFKAALSSKTFALFAPCLRSARTLSLAINGGSQASVDFSGMLGIKNLTSLEICLHNGRTTSKDLFHLSAHGSNIHTFRLLGQPLIQGLSDETFGQFIANLSRLTTLEMQIQLSPLTNTSLIHIGAFCLDLVSCNINCLVNWEELVDKITSEMFQNLICLKTFSDNLTQPLPELEQYAAFEVANKILELFPSLVEFGCDDEDLDDRATAFLFGAGRRRGQA